MIAIVGLTKDTYLYKCFLDGEDISEYAFAASEEGEWVVCYQRTADGHKYRDGNGRTAMELRRGKVKLLHCPYLYPKQEAAKVSKSPSKPPPGPPDWLEKGFPP